MRFLIDEDRCMRCGLCEEVCPTDQERYGNQKAIVLGTGHLSIQSSVYDRGDNVLDLNGLTYHSRTLGLQLNAVMGSGRPKEDILVNSPDAAGLRLSGGPPILPERELLSLTTRLKAFWLRLYAPLYLLKKGLPLRPKPEARHRGRGRAGSWPSITELAGKKRDGGSKH
jgi:ferredoxin